VLESLPVVVGAMLPLLFGLAMDRVTRADGPGEN
jgi:hypothetical protein